MALIRTGTTKIRTGASRIIQQAPPQRISRRERRETPQREIAFIAETKKLEEARGEIRRDRRRREEEEPRTITELVQEVKDSGLGAAEAGYALSRLFKTAEVELKPELKAWCNTQISQYQKVMAEAKAEYKEELEKLKDKYPDDPIKFTNARLKLMAKVYPKWSSKAQQAKEKFEERQNTLAKAITAAKEAGIKGLSSDELYAMATTTKASAKKQAKEKGITDEQLAAIRGEKLPAVATGIGIGAGAGIVIEPEEVEQPVTTIPATAEEKKKAAEAKAEAEERGWSCYTQIDTYKVKLKDGTTILVEALSKGAAEDKVEAAGHKVAWTTKMLSFESVEPSKVKTGAFNVTMDDGTKVTMIPFTEQGTGDTLLLPKNTVGQLEETDAYKQAKGTDQEKLGVAYAAVQQQYDTWVNQLKTENPDLYKEYEAKGPQALEDYWHNQLKEADPELYQEYLAGKITKEEIIAKQIAAYNEFQEKIESGDLIQVGDGNYIERTNFDKLPKGTQGILMKGGFALLEDITTTRWQSISEPSKVLTDTEYKKLCNDYDAKLKKLAAQGKNMYEIVEEIGHNPANEYTLDSNSAKRALIGLAAMVAPPTKTALPEYTIKDITPIEWGITGANVALIAVGFAPGAVASSIAGKAIVYGASGALSGMISYETAKNWNALTPAQKGLGIGMATLCAVPLLTTTVRNVKIGPSTPIPTAKGDVVAWKGLSVAGYPIIGRSGGKWVLGTRSLTLPEARLILNGYKPETMLETKVFVNKSALSKAGLSQTQIDYLTQTLKSRNLFAGKMSPWLSKEALTEPTQRLNAKEVDTIIRQLNSKADDVKDASLLYGSPTIKAQAAPELRGWRAIHDWDISLNLNQTKTEAWTRQLLTELRAKGSGIYRINPKVPTLIEKKIGGKWEHIVDIHSQELVTGSAVDIPASKLDVTGEYSYGRMVAEPAITVKYPGIGELKIMRLSESGIRKADTILRVRQTPEGTAFKPPERGIAQPGVPKDAADFYVVLRTLKGEKLAEDWLGSWAKAMGYTDAQLATVLPKIRNAMIEVAAQTPSNIIGYKFVPSKASAGAGASPSISLTIPKSLAASASPSLAAKISEPIYPYKLATSPKVKAMASASLATLASKAPSKYVMASPITSKGKPSPSGQVSGVPSPSPAPSPTPSPTPYPYPIKQSMKPSPVPLPSPSPSPYPYPSTYPRPSPKPKVSFKPTRLDTERMPKPGQSLQVWDQGAYWITIVEPFRTTGTKPDVIFSRKKPPWAGRTAKGRRSPQKTFRAIGRGHPARVELPMGRTTAVVLHGKTLKFRGAGGRRRGRIVA